MADNHIIVAPYCEDYKTKTDPVYQYDYGQVLQLDGFENLPDPFEMHFASDINGESLLAIGEDGIVAVPDECLMRRQPVYAWLFMHDDENDGETVYLIEIPIISRAKIPKNKATPEQRDEIEHAIALLQTAMEDLTGVKEDITQLKSGDAIPVADVAQIINDYEGS